MKNEQYYNINGFRGARVANSHGFAGTLADAKAEALRLKEFFRYLTVSIENKSGQIVKVLR